MVENHTSANVEVDQEKVNTLIDFGFSREQATLALKISSNNTEQAVELLVSGGADLESLQALAQSASIKQGENPAQEKIIAPSNQQAVGGGDAQLLNQFFSGFSSEK